MQQRIPTKLPAWIAMLLVLAAGAAGTLSTGCGGAMVQLPTPECSIKQSATFDNAFAHVCTCDPGGVEFKYKRVAGGWQTRQLCNGKPMHRVMTSAAFPAWTGPPPPDKAPGAASPGPPELPDADEIVEDNQPPAPPAEPASVVAPRPDRPGSAEVSP